jgi:hypothetical protein
MDKKIPMHVQRRSLTAELVALVERFEPDPGPEPGTTEHTERSASNSPAGAARASSQP